MPELIKNSFHTRRPSLDVAPTALAQRTRQSRKTRASVTYLECQIQVCFLADRAFVSPGGMHA